MIRRLSKLLLLYNRPVDSGRIWYGNSDSSLFTNNGLDGLTKIYMSQLCTIDALKGLPYSQWLQKWERIAGYMAKQSEVAFFE